MYRSGQILPQTKGRFVPNETVHREQASSSRTGLTRHGVVRGSRARPRLYAREPAVRDTYRNTFTPYLRARKAIGCSFDRAYHAADHIDGARQTLPGTL